MMCVFVYGLLGCADGDNSQLMNFVITYNVQLQISARQKGQNHLEGD
jgi:hypothetical protein